MADGYAHFQQAGQYYPNFSQQRLRRSPPQTPSPSRSPAPQSPGSYFYSPNQAHHNTMMNQAHRNFLPQQQNMAKFFPQLHQNSQQCTWRSSAYVLWGACEPIVWLTSNHRRKWYSKCTEQFTSLARAAEFIEHVAQFCRTSSPCAAGSYPKQKFIGLSVSVRGRESQLLPSNERATQKGWATRRRSRATERGR
jgi:hypothetical protein